MQSSFPIPIPFALRWREFRIRALPPLVYLGSVAIAAILWTKQVATTSLPGQVEAVAAQVGGPKAGMLPELDYRGFQVAGKGDPTARVQPIAQALRSSPATRSVELDFPVVIRLPANVELAPGEIVDLKISAGSSEKIFGTRAIGQSKQIDLGTPSFSRPKLP